MGIRVGAPWLEHGERFCSDICPWTELSTTWLTRDAVSLLLGLPLGKALSPQSVCTITLGIKLLCCTSWCSIKT